MQLREITCRDFGPFVGEQTVSVPEGRGVLVVYGQNGKGKTTLLNAIRWAFTGVFRDRGERERPAERLVNRDDPATTEARVRVKFYYDGADYELTRVVRKSSAGATQNLTLLRDNVGLSRADADRELLRIMPTQVQDFFAFDAEHLNRYESLLNDDHEAGRKLEEDIDRILGVPVLKNAADDCQAVSDEASATIAAEMAKNRQTAKQAESILQLQKQMEQHKSNMAAEQGRCSELEAQLHRLDIELAEQSGKLELIGQRQAKQDELLDRRAELVDAKAELGGALDGGWKAVLVSTLEPLCVDLTEREASLRDARDRSSAAAVLRRHLEEAGDTCPVCHSDLDGDHRHDVEAFLELLGGEDGDATDRELREVQSKLDLLRPIADADSVRVLIERTKAFKKAALKVNDLEVAIKDLNDQLVTTPADSLKAKQKERENTSFALIKAREQRDEEERAEEKARTKAQDLQTEAQRKGHTTDPAAANRQKYAKGLRDLLLQAATTYRRRLRAEVEMNASEIFRSMRAEPDFDRLKINDHYGLSIINTEGDAVVERSAGYEHLVALSLIGALQRSSLVTGPVIMDSPFGRLDKDHFKAVLKGLPELAEQIILLVHERELAPAEASGMFPAGSLLAEYELQRVSSTHTNIVRTIHGR